MAAIEVLDQRYSGLSGPVAGLYRSLAWCPAVFLDTPALAVIAGCSWAEASAMAGSLIEAGLVRRAPGPAGAGLRIALDTAGRVHAGTVAAGEPQLDAAGRWLDYLAGCAAAVDRRVTPTHRLPFPDWSAPEVGALPFGPGAGEAVAWLVEQRPNYASVIRWTIGESRFDLAYTLVQLLWPLWLWARPAETIEMLELGLAAAGALGDPHALGQMRTTLAGQLRGTPSESWRAFALDRAAQRSADQSGDERALAQAVNALGKDALAAGLTDTAQEYFTEAEQMRLELKDTRGAGLSRQGLAKVAADRGELALAIEHLEQAHTMLAEAGDVFDTLLVKAELGVLRARTGNLGKGLDQIEAARAGLEAAGADYGQVLVLKMQATTLHAAGRCAAAARAVLRAADLLEPLDAAGAARLREGA